MDGDDTQPSKPEDGPVGGTAASPDPIAKNFPAPRVKGPKRRTKTGCLTCRKRRIKCGEEKPRCNNCNKSKRECEGYAQRVIFRNPVGPISHLGTGPMPQNYIPQGHVADPLPFLRRASNPAISQTELSGRGSSFIPLAPRPDQYPPGTIYRESHLLPNFEHEPAFAHHTQERHQSSQNYYAQQYTAADVDPSMQETPLKSQFRSVPPREEPQYASGFLYARTDSDQIPRLQSYHDSTGAQMVSPVQFEHPNMSTYGQTEYKQPESAPNLNASSHGEYVLGTATHQDLQQATYYYEDEKDDYWDVDSEGEMDHNYVSPTTTKAANKFMQPSRSSTAFTGDEYAMMSYSPSAVASPLMDPEVTRVFCHFVASVAPALSPFERHPVNPTVMLSTNPIPSAQQSLWTYTMPTMALTHQGLLQAILAVSTHHIAKIRGGSLTPSFRHYHYALRRVSKAVKIPNRRNQISTLAATLLLAFYEVMDAEHSKWNSHVAGAAQLVQEIDFVGMTRDIRAMRSRAKAEQLLLAQSNPWIGLGAPSMGSRFDNDLFADKEGEIDDQIISTLMGRSVRYNNFEDSENDYGFETGRQRNLTPKDIEDYRIRSDLYWFYCKQDVYQSMISGNPLLMPYGLWGACPPRAGIGKLDAVYGSFDHLLLLLARTVDFSSRDRKRKVKMVKRNGGAWRPPPGFFPPGMGRGQPPGPKMGPPTGPPPGPPPNAPGDLSGPSSDKQREPSPPMYGMVPNTGPIRLPAGFAETAPQPPQSSSPEPNNVDLDQQTADAELEWQNIRAAFESFEQALGSSFAPLPADGTPPLATPFGPAIQYRTHTIACVWAFYYTGRIILERIHPSMPPEAMVAAAVGAFRTGLLANSIGRIVAGIYYPQRFDSTTANLVPTVSGVLTDIMICLFFSAVQYTDAAQRGWTIAKLRNIARMTGSGSSTAVASGCETAWTKAYEAGKGPPYQRTMNSREHEDRGQGIVSEPGDKDRMFITVSRSASLHWAMGLLSIQGDYAKADERG
ncbi:hypothetical protein FQN53_003508 [Emmonsiellopsis sp. PD_33]|nr:hypothetical protein FQN53_003508 [Emmonsiellopsis sp. PD_33]